METAIRSMTVFYDDTCSFCVRIKLWMQKVPRYFELDFIGLHETACKERFPDILDRFGSEQFLALTDSGAIYVGSNARIMCLYALKPYRSLALTLSDPALFRFADTFFEYISSNRQFISKLIQVWAGDPEWPITLPANDTTKACSKGFCGSTTEKG
jgi:predicted DCC family thiol-disulfide oxidoreductase YuxK